MTSYHDLFNKSLNINKTTPIAATVAIPKFVAVGVTDEARIAPVGTTPCTLTNYQGLLTEDLEVGGYPKTQMMGVMSMHGSGYTPLTPGDLVFTVDGGGLQFAPADFQFSITGGNFACIGICLTETDIFLFAEPTNYDGSATAGAGALIKLYGRTVAMGVLPVEYGGTGSSNVADVLAGLALEGVTGKVVGTGSHDLAAGDHAHQVGDIKATTSPDGSLAVASGGMLTTVPAGNAILPAVAAITHDVTGFPNRTDTSITFNSATREVTLTALNADACIYFRGVKKPLTNSISVTWTDTTGARYIVFDPTDNQLKEDTGFPSILNGAIFVAYVYWNAVDQLAPVLGDERHLSSRDTQWHYTQHRDVGAVWCSGGGLTYTTNDPTNCTLGIATPLVIADEDLEHVIIHSAAAVNNYEQNLATAARIPVLWKNGAGVTETPSTSTFPFLDFGGRACYNPVVAGVGSKVVCPNDTYMNYWLIATNDTRQPVKLVMGRAIFTSSADSSSESIDDLGIPLAEMAILYRIVLHISDTYVANPARAVINKVVKITRPNSNGGQTTISAESHDFLAGRELPNQHPISSITGLADALSGKVDIVAGKSLSTNDFTNLQKTSVDNLVNGVMPELMILPNKTVSTTPAADTLYLWAEKIAGRMTPKIKSASDAEALLQSFLGNGNMMLLSPASGTAFSIVGATAPTIVGTVSTPTPTTGSNLLAATRRSSIISAAAANSASDLRVTSFPVYFGGLFSGVKSGGFFAVFKTGISSSVVGQRQVVGLSSNTSAFATTLQPSAITNSIILANDNTDSNMQIMHNDASGTCTKIDLGTAFPAGASAANNVYELTMFCEPNGNTVEYSVKNITTNVITSGVISTNLPPKTTMLYPRVYANNNNVATAVTINMFRIYIETGN